MSWITAPFAWLLKALYELTGSYGWAAKNYERVDL